MTSALDNSYYLVKLFTEKSIKVTGTPNDPLFKAADVASYIEDVNYLRTISQYDDDEVLDSGGPRNYKVLTEAGLYRYLMQSTRPKTHEFRKWVVQVLIELRKKIVSDALIKAKIAEDALEIEKVNIKEAYSNMVSLCVSYYDDTQLDSDGYGLANFYISNYIASYYFRHKVIPFKKCELPSAVVEVLQNAAFSYFRCPQSIYEEFNNRVLDQYVEKIKKTLAPPKV